MGTCPSRERRKKYLAELERYQRDLEKAVAEARAAWVDENRFRRRNGLPLLPDPAESNYNLALTGPPGSGAGGGGGTGLGAAAGGTGAGAAAGGGLRGGQRPGPGPGLGATDSPMRNALSGAGVGGSSGIRRSGLGASGIGASGLGASGLGASGLGSNSLGASGLGSSALGASGLGLSGLGGAGGGGNRRGDQGRERARSRCQPQKNSIHCTSVGDSVVGGTLRRSPSSALTAVSKRGRQIRVFSP